MFSVFCAVALLAISAFATEFNTIPVKRPAKFLVGYSGYELGTHQVDAMTKNYFAPMQKSGFNTVELKIFQVKPGNRLDVSNPEIFAELKSLVNAANEHNLLFSAYVFTEPYTGKRNVKEYPQHKDLPAFVDEDGKTIDNLFSIIHYNVMREVYNNAFELAKASTKLPIAQVKFDIENIFNFGISYDDPSWKMFCAENPEFKVNTPASERVSVLKAANAQDKYKAWFILQFEKTVQRIERELHAINPNLILGLMPTELGWVSKAFAKYLATPQAPAVMDDWSMYAGDGYNKDFVSKRQAELKALNPNNLYVAWLRLNSHQPDDLPSQLYHVALETDGYDVWAMHMVDPDFKEVGYELPNGKTIADYYNAFATVNQAVRADLAGDKNAWGKRIEYKKLVAATQPLDLKITIPDLIPAGNGTGPTQGFALRDQQTAYIYAETGEMISATITHLSGTARKVAVQYALIDRDGNKLRNEIVLPGDEKRFGMEKFAVAAPYTGVYALTVSGGTGGLAWYGLEIHNKHYAFEATDRGNPESHGIYLMYSSGSFNAYLLRNGQTGNAQLVGEKREGMVFDYAINGGRKIFVANNNYTIDLPESQVIKITFSRPEKMKETQYMQDFIFYTRGAVLPYLYDNPERALIPKK